MDELELEGALEEEEEEDAGAQDVVGCAEEPPSPRNFSLLLRLLGRRPGNSRRIQGQGLEGQKP